MGKKSPRDNGPGDLLGMRPRYTYICILQPKAAAFFRASRREAIYQATRAAHTNCYFPFLHLFSLNR